MSLALGLKDLNGALRRILGEDWEDITDEEIAVMKEELQKHSTAPDGQLEAVSDRTESLSTKYRTTGPTLSDDQRKPYPWCHGNPTIQDCIEAGYCRRDPSCGD
jgi:hypothetical protein